MNKRIQNLLAKTTSVCAALATAAVFAEEAGTGGADLARGFAAPPASARSQVWWHWMAGNVTREGIKADLEAMAEVGIGGAILFDVGGMRWGVPEGTLAFNSPEWYETVKFAAEEANRLGLELGIANCSGWANSGGPWNTPEYAMKRVVFTQTEIKGGTRVSVTLPQPDDPVGFYRDIAVLAYPTPAARHSVSDWRYKTFSYPGRKYTHPDTNDAPANAVVQKRAVVELTKQAADGTLTWDAPAGQWTVLRIGYSALKCMNGPSTKHGKGLECDKLSKEALRIHWANYVGKTVAALGPLAGTNAVLKTVLNDSYEVGTQNWTRDFEKAFAKRNGYDITPWLPTLAGRVVESVAATEAFYRDFRLTITEMFAENYAGEMRRLAHASGLQLAIEPYGEIPSDDLLYGEQADIPMAEFWAKLDSPHWVRQAASIAHAKGRRVVAAESFTTNGTEGQVFNQRDRSLERILLRGRGDGW
ncbi:MAG TPA: glycosyl hydrolase [Kiritimatiellia bacterium]|nr:glycosyl hydrolase [Kiritimatiellia bacterium]